MKCISVEHLGYGLHYAIVILRVGQSKVLTCREKVIKREGEEGRELHPTHGGGHDTRSKSQNGSNLGNGGKGEEWLYTITDRCLVDKNKGDNYVLL